VNGRKNGFGIFSEDFAAWNKFNYSRAGEE
jgi:hypothetical protein